MASAKTAIVAPSVDVFSFGCLGQFVMTGQPPDVGQRLGGGSNAVEGASKSLPCDQICQACLTLCNTCASVEESSRPAMIVVHDQIRSCPKLLPCVGVEQSRFEDRVTSGWKGGLRELLVQQFAADTRQLAINVNLTSEALVVLAATKGWILHTGTDPTGKPLECVFAGGLAPKLKLWALKCIQGSESSSFSSHWGWRTVDYGTCRGGHPNNRRVKAMISMTVSNTIAPYLESDHTVVKISLSGLKKPDPSVATPIVWEEDLAIRL